MHFVHEQRRLAIRDALADPLEARTAARLASDFGVSSAAHLNRSFRARFDITPGGWRRQNLELARSRGQHGVEPFWRWFNNLGRQERL